MDAGTLLTLARELGPLMYTLSFPDCRGPCLQCGAFVSYCPDEAHAASFYICRATDDDDLEETVNTKI